ncbi:MAG TPA: ATP-binding protein [Thermoanaerobaculia bacterium]|jgi:DNA replication protein DnaC|nr:ATP-binding protein [Thermoanaerobaculia bacterium]
MAVHEVERAVCPSCGGRGWVVQLDGGAGTARPCFCRQYEVVPRLVAAAGVPDRYRECRLANFKVASGSAPQRAELMAARAAAQNYANHFLTTQGFAHSGLLFIGPPGAGKTHLAVSVLIDVIERYSVRGRFVELSSFFNQMQSTFGQTSSESTQAVLAPLMDAPLLVLDELGTQQPTPWIRDVLYLVINTRYTRRLPTLFTTNYRLPAGAAEAAPGNGQKQNLDRGRDPETTWEEATALASRLPSMLVSRLYEMAQPVLLTGVGDFRRDQSAQKARRR